jgi:MFS transporter, MHS family, proline/betaine transporter
MCIQIGNALEWYDFAIFGALADVFGAHFFPVQSSGAQLMAAFSVYCSAFFMRPIGGLIFGYIGDTYGRKKALEISIGLMIATSFFIGVLPTYEMIGYSATVLIVLLRMLQGFAVGGEMVGAYIYTGVLHSIVRSMSELFV